ncbi:hypothetical protein TWF788_010237 [Orbilia oligospora]|uniref:Uncharacterized protein n=1 Tax=Orbilia oligospora TaxID=2813651 RepID=A0A7C8PJ37_ORBOL|nr:hypothetical protein TWF788_010237 [Orbilia oligospora]
MPLILAMDLEEAMRLKRIRFNVRSERSQTWQRLCLVLATLGTLFSILPNITGWCANSTPPPMATAAAVAVTTTITTSAGISLETVHIFTTVTPIVTVLYSELLQWRSKLVDQKVLSCMANTKERENWKSLPNPQNRNL